MAWMQPLLKLYVDRLSQPPHALIIFCRVNKIDFEEARVDIAKGQHRAPEFKKINPMGRVPAIVDGRFRLFERYPADLFTRANVESILDWHHSNLRRGAGGMSFPPMPLKLAESEEKQTTRPLYTALAPSLGLTPNPEAAKEAEKLLARSLETIESVWLKGDAKFLNGNLQPSIADLSLVCEIMQLEVVGDDMRDRILGPCEKICAWMENVKKATSPYFEEAHELIFKLKARLLSAAYLKTDVPLV